MDTSSDPLFVATTRPAMKWGVTMDAIVVGGAITAIVFIGTGSIFTLLLYVPIHSVMYLLCLKDPNIIRLIKLWGVTKAKSIGWRFWGAATAAPIPNTRNKKGIQE
jgi:type IV secretion system protein VirB3